MKVLKWLDNNLEQAILLILLCGMTIVMGGQIIARYAFSASLSWSEEITRYMFIISGFISASYCIKNGLSVKIDQLVGMLPGKGVHYMRLVSYLIQLLFFAYLVPFAWKYVNCLLYTSFEKMFSPIQIGPIEVKNRFVVPPMGNN